MRQNLATVLILLAVIAASGMYGSWRNQQPASRAESAATPQVETRVGPQRQAVAYGSPTGTIEDKGIPLAGGCTVGALALGDTRQEVEALNRPRGLKQATLACGLTGNFPDCPGQASIVAYGQEHDDVVALRGPSLTLPDRTVIDSSTTVETLEKLLGPGQRQTSKAYLLRLDYPHLGLSFHVRGVNSAPDEVYVTEAELSFAWEPTRP